MSEVARYRASSGVSTGGSNDVSQWATQVGVGHYLQQTTTSRRPTLVDMAFGEKALRFDGLQMMEALTSTLHEFTSNDFSLAIVFKPKYESATQAVIVQKGKYHWTQEGYRLTINGANHIPSSSLLFSVTDLSVQSDVSSAVGSTTLGEKHVVILTRDGTSDELKMLHNGVLTTDTPASSVGSISTPNLFAIGGENTNPNNSKFEGWIAEVRVYDHALSVAEMNVEHDNLDGLYEMRLVPEFAHEWNGDNVNVSAGRISEAQDTIGSEDLKDPSAANKPYFSDGATNGYGKNALEFQGNQFLRISGSSAIYPGTDDVTVVVDFIPTYYNDFRTIWAYDNGSMKVSHFATNPVGVNQYISSQLVDVDVQVTTAGNGWGPFNMYHDKANFHVFRLDNVNDLLEQFINGEFIDDFYYSPGAIDAIRNQFGLFVMGGSGYDATTAHLFYEGLIFRLRFVRRKLSDIEVTDLYKTFQEEYNRPPTIGYSASSSVNEGETEYFQINSTDPDNDTLIYSISGHPSFMTCNPNTGLVTVAPGFDDAGVVSGVTAHVTDGFVTVNMATPSFTVVNITLPPIITPLTQPTFNEGVNEVWDFTSNLDPTSNPSWSIANEESWMTIEDNDSSMRLWVNAPYDGGSGTYPNVQIILDDGLGLPGSIVTEVVSIVVNEVNLQTSIFGTPPTTVNEGQPYSFTPSVTNPDNDPLTYVISNKPSWANFNSTTGELSDSPSHTDSGVYSNIDIGVNDGKSTVWLGTFAITVNEVNRLPGLTHSMPNTVNENTPYIGFVQVVDADTDNTLSISVLDKPDWMNAVVTGSRLDVTGTPDFEDAGTDQVDIEYSDGYVTFQASYPITVFNVNQIPQIGGIPGTEIKTGELYVFEPVANDLDVGTELVYSIQNKPHWATFDTQTGKLWGTPSYSDYGLYENILISVSDGEDGADLDAFDIEVHYVDRIRTELAMFNCVLPDGRGWNTSHSPSLKKLLRAMSEVMADFKERTDHIPFEMLPHETKSLDLVEQQRGVTLSGLSDEERRGYLASLWTSQDNQSATSIKEALASIGIVAGVYENHTLVHPDIWLQASPVTGYLLVNGNIPVKRKDYTNQYGDENVEYDGGDVYGEYAGILDIPRQYEIGTDVDDFIYYFVIADVISSTIPLTLPIAMKPIIDELILRLKPVRTRAIMFIVWEG